MKSKSQIWIIGIVVAAAAILYSCGSDDSVTIPAPEADFTSSIDGKTVTFTDASSNADTYSWDFGDGNSSTDASPSHTYTANGSYIAKLTVSNVTGEDDKSEVLEIVNITIDGSFDDWADVAAIGNQSGTITSIKIENLGSTKLFVYVEGTDELTGLTQMPLNIDNNDATGALITWRYPTSGDDILVEGNFPQSDDQYGSLYACEPCDGSAPGNWNYAATPYNEDITSFLEVSALVDISGGKAYEMALDLTALGASIDSEVIGIAVMHMSDVTWDVVGASPPLYNENDNPDAEFYTYTFK